MTATREFTDSDWMGFMGCMPWNAGSIHAKQPLIRSTQNFEIVADAQVVGCYFEFDEEQEQYFMDLVFPTQAAARLFLDAIPDDIDQGGMAALGFKTL